MRVSVINAGSARRKINDVIRQFKYRQTDVVCISETWEKLDFDKDEFEQLNGLTWLSRPRPGSNLGGGVAVVVNNTFADAKILDIKVPDPLEIIWVSIHPKKKADVKILIACFYCSNTKKYRAPKGLIELHVMDVIHKYMAISDEYRILVCGDINKENLVGIEDLPQFASNIDVPTRGDAFLEYAVSNLVRLQCKAYPPLAPDNPFKQKKSDHHIATIDYEVPAKKPRQWIIRKKRKFNSKKLEKFFSDFREINWWKELNLPTVDEQNDRFNTILTSLVDKHFEYETVRCKEKDVLWYTESLRRQQRKARKNIKKVLQLLFYWLKSPTKIIAKRRKKISTAIV